MARSLAWFRRGKRAALSRFQWGQLASYSTARSGAVDASSSASQKMSIFSRKLGRNPFKSSGSADAADAAPSQTQASMSAKAKAAATADCRQGATIVGDR